ncbi:AAA family ATPase [Streptomyces sp. NPDC012510]|uniref:helix-turn-helix transcriptional regulator n=1 Tax=Streptomyces sp. NPDC012510 TaxID=3364838 RepID=UPI0036E8B4C7
MLSRDCEVSDLQRVLASAASGAGASLLIEGGVGSGKSYLVRAAVRTARAHGFETMSTRARPSGTALPYDVLRQMHGVPVSAGPGAPLAGELTEGWLDQLVGSLALRKPLLLAVDDLHWADQSSLHRLEQLMARLEGLPVALVGTLAPGMAPPREEPRGDRRGTLARVVSDFHQCTVLSGLAPDAVGYLLASFFGRPVAESLVHACHRATGGNPLLTQALLRELRRVGTVGEPTCDQVAALGSVEVAETVVARFEERFSGVGRALDAVAVIGRAATPALVAELVGIPCAEAADMLHVLVRCGVLQESGEGVAFAQPMVPVSFLAALPPSERARLHAAAARALHALGAPAHEVVHHLRRATRIGERWAYRLLFDSACAALSRHDLEEARLLQERCALEDDPDDRSELLRRLSRVELAADAPAVAASRLRALGRPRGGDDTDAVVTLVNLALATALDGDLTGARRTLHAALADFGHLDPLDPAQEPTTGAFAVLGVLGVLTMADGAGRALLPAPRSAPAPASAPARTPWVRCAQATLSALAVRQHGGRREEAVRYARLGLGEPTGPADVPTTPLRLLLAQVLCDAGEYDEALDVCRELAATARQEGARTMAALAEVTLAVCCHRAGRLREAARAARTALADGPPGTWLGSALARCWLGGVLVETGDLDGARRMLLDDLALASLPASALPDLLLHRGRLHAALGNTEAALADLEECGRLLRGAHGRYPWRATAAVLHAHAGDPAAAERLAREELDAARAWGAPRTVAVALHTLAQVTRGGQNVSLLYEAAGLLEGSGAWLEHARVLRSLGRELQRRRKIRSAREQLRAALALAEKCGAWALVDALRDDLASAGARPRRGAETGLNALTPAEYRTALLAAEGLTNREIADRLYVTRRTVELHLSRVYRKLSVSGRSDLPAAVTDSLPAPGQHLNGMAPLHGAPHPMTLRPAS